MKSILFPTVILGIAFLLILIDLITADPIEKGFWLRSTSNVLLILAMVFVITEKKKTKTEE